MSLLVGLALYLATARSIENDAEVRFLGLANNAANTIAVRLKTYGDVVRSTRGLLQSPYPVTRRQFRDFVTSLDFEQHFPGIETISFVAYVDGRDRDAFERRMRERDKDEQRLADQIPFAIQSSERHSHYMVVTLAEPSNDNELGGTISPTRLHSFFLARDNGQLTSSGLPLLYRDGSRLRLGLRLPVYSRDAPIETVEQRRRAYLGAVGIVFSVDALVKGVIDDMPVKNAHLRMVDREHGDEGWNGLLFESNRTPVPASALGSRRFTRTLPIDFNGHLWEATFSAGAKDLYSPFEEYIPWLAMLAGTIASLLLYALIESLMSSRRRSIRLAEGMTRELRESQAKLQSSHEKLRQLASHADNIKEGERKRIAREIHDDLGQSLLVLKIDAEMLTVRTKGRQMRLHERAADTLRHIDTCIKSVRQIINDLRPNALDLGLSAAVEWQVGEFRRRTGLECELVDETNDIAFQEQVATAFLRILQESLSNIVRHANASKVSVVLSSMEGAFSMTIRDDGIGLPGSGRCKPGSFGLIGIEERVALLGGSCSISNAPDGGTVVAVSVPLDRHDLLQAVAEDLLATAELDRRRLSPG